jgi:ApaG protein
MAQEDQTSVAVTAGIRITVTSHYQPDRSLPLAGHYVFSYTVRIRNEGPQAAQLRHRHWIITDVSGRTEEVQGAGVVGEQPVLGPGAEFEYTSSAVLKTPRGSMRGAYLMQRPGGRTFRAEIAPFALALPYSLN